MTRKWKQVPLPSRLRPMLDAGLIESDIACYQRKGGYLCWVGTMPDGKKHLSISHPTMAVTWEEIKDARYEFIHGRRYMAMILPPLDEYVNIHHNQWHLHEVDADEGTKGLLHGGV